MTNLVELYHLTKRTFSGKRRSFIVPTLGCKDVTGLFRSILREYVNECANKKRYPFLLPSVIRCNSRLKAVCGCATRCLRIPRCIVEKGFWQHILQDSF